MIEFMMELSAVQSVEQRRAIEIVPARGTIFRGARSPPDVHVFQGVRAMRGVLMWLIGIPIPIIILLYLFKAV